MLGVRGVVLALVLCAGCFIGTVQAGGGGDSGVIQLTKPVPASSGDGLILVVGDVDYHRAKILYECDPTALNKPAGFECPQTVKLYLSATEADDSGSSLIETVSIQLEPRARTWTFTQLKPSTRYFVNIETGTRALGRAYFRTFPDPNTPPPTEEAASSSQKRKSRHSAGGGDDFTFISTSCNRYFEDRDDSFLEQLGCTVLGADQWGVDGTFHLGDQVYGDTLKANYSRLVALGRRPTYTQVLGWFRTLYRITWGGSTHTQRLLRSGAHWMIPDDHDLFDNADAHHYMLPGPNGTAPVWKEYMEAGRRAWYEYQGQLRFDVSVNYTETNEEETRLLSAGDTGYPAPAALNVSGCGSDILYMARRVGYNTGFIMLDTRFTRVFGSSNPMRSEQYGAKQLKWLETVLAEWSAPTTHSNITNIMVFQAVPFLFINPIASWVSYEVVKEKYSAHTDLLDETQQLLAILKPYAQRVKLFAGDIHQYVETEICTTSDAGSSSSSTGRVCLSQVCSSGVSNSTAALSEAHVYAFFALNAVSSRSAGVWTMTDRNAFLDNNAALIRVQPVSGITTTAILRSDETRPLCGQFVQALYPTAGFIVIASVVFGIPIAILTCVIGRLCFCLGCCGDRGGQHPQHGSKSHNE